MTRTSSVCRSPWLQLIMSGVYVRLHFSCTRLLSSMAVITAKLTQLCFHCKAELGTALELRAVVQSHSVKAESCPGISYHSSINTMIDYQCIETNDPTLRTSKVLLSIVRLNSLTVESAAQHVHQTLLSRHISARCFGAIQGRGLTSDVMVETFRAASSTSQRMEALTPRKTTPTLLQMPSASESPLVPP